MLDPTRRAGYQQERHWGASIADHDQMIPEATSSCEEDSLAASRRPRAKNATALDSEQ